MKDKSGSRAKRGSAVRFSSPCRLLPTLQQTSRGNVDRVRNTWCEILPLGFLFSHRDSNHTRVPVHPGQEHKPFPLAKGDLLTIATVSERQSLTRHGNAFFCRPRARL